MSGPGISSDDELTVEALQRKKEDLHEHGLGDSTLTDAVDQQIEEREREDAKRKKLVEKKILLKQAEKAGLEDDPDVAALRASVEDLDEELEAEALSQEMQEAHKKLDSLEGLQEAAKQQNNDALAAKYRQKAEALKAKHPELEDDDGNRYDTGPTEAEALKQDEAAAALEEFQDQKWIAEHDKDLPDEAKHRLNDFKMLREQASTPALRQMYQKKMDALREEYAEVYETDESA